MKTNYKDYKIILNGIPEVVFAHAHLTNNYNFLFREKKNFIELTYFEHSSAISETLDGEKLELPSNSIHALLYDEPRKIYADGYQLHFTVAFNVDYRMAEPNEKGAICLRQIVTEKKFVQEASEIIKLCTKKILHPNKSKLELSALILQLFSLYEKNNETHSTGKPISPITIKYAEQAQEYILNNIRTSFSVSDIANYLGISSGYLSNVFHEVTGTSIVQYTNRVRLEIAKNLVCNECATLAEACVVSGINDPNYLSRMFRKYMDTTITEIKTNVKKPR